MDLDIKAAVLALDTGEVVTLDDAAGTRVMSRCGTVWVTEENDVLDHIVGPGDAYLLVHGGRTIIQALRPAWISLAKGGVTS